MMQQKWQRTVQLALEYGTRQARKLEEELWKTQGLVVQISPRQMRHLPACSYTYRRCHIMSLPPEQRAGDVTILTRLPRACGHCSMKMRDQRGKEVKLRPRNLECTAYA